MNRIQAPVASCTSGEHLLTAACRAALTAEATIGASLSADSTGLRRLLT